MRLRNLGILAIAFCSLVLLLSSGAWAQVNTVNLSGTVLDPQNLSVKDARISVKNLATGAERTTASDANGRYDIVGLPPGRYSMTVEAGAFAPFTNSSLTLTLGATAEYNPQLQLKTSAQTVSVEASPDVVDTSKTDTSSTITSLQIDNLPINGRNYINFTLLNSQAARDDTPSIGAAPTSGLNFGGQRGRSNEVSVDGADAVDNSVNGVRATVSQEAVQEFQVITSNYMPEYGRAMGGVVNIVTKSGSNHVHGDVFGFLRDSAIQARNPFSVDAVFDPNTETFGTVPVKQSYTRVQSGATIGGPIQKDKTFYFFSYEITRRQETGFTNIGADNFGLAVTPAPADIAPYLPLGVPAAGLLTAGASGQQSFVNNASNDFFQRIMVYSAGVTSSAVALFGNTGALPGPANAFPSSGAPLPASFVGLSTTIGNYPISEGTSLWSLKLDHIWNSSNTSFIRANVSPSKFNGIQVNSQNENFGQNAGSRTSNQQTRDLAIVGQHATAISSTLFNEFRFQYARRGLHYGFSDLPGGSDPAVNIAGAAFIGREPFSTEDRIEKRYEWTDNLTWTKGAHTFKFGVDTNFVQLQSSKSEIFTLNYGGVYDFGSVSASDLPGFDASDPSFSPVQAYGLGIPTVFYQGIGTSDRPFNNKTLGVFAQDSWKLTRKLTVNYGLRYDIEFLPIFKAGTSVNTAAEQAFRVVEGIPQSKKDFAPRIGIAWDPMGDGKTVIRAGYGIFYDHPALALAFLSTAEDGATSALLEAAGGAPDGSLNATSIFQGILNVPDMGCDTSSPMMCYEPQQQIFNPFQANSLFTNQNFLSVPNPYVSGATGYPLAIIPYTIPVSKNFKYGYAQQVNLTVEREITKDLKVSLGYNFTHGLHLDRTININVADPGFLIPNDNNAVLSGLVTPGTNPLTVEAPNGAPGACISTSTGSVQVIAPTILGVGFAVPGCNTTPLGYIGTPAAFNYFRPSGPNPSFAGLVGGYPALVGLAQLAGFPQGFPGVQVPWSDVNPQSSSGNSIYNAFTLTVTKRFSHDLELLSSWTYSHTIDDSTDLSTLLNPQDNSNPNGERGNSDFDQRHRWITSAVYLSPYKNSDESLWKKFLADFTVAPVVEVSSGRPFNVLIGSDTNLDFGSSTGRPSVQTAGTAVPAGFPAATTSPYISGVQFILPDVCLDNSLTAFQQYPYVPSPPFGCTGNLSRNAFTRPMYFDIDLRIARKIPINEHVDLQVIADGFNMLNRFNVSDVNPVCDPTAGLTTCAAGQPTAASDPRTFQFALKLEF
jgi:Carboxypeptidase regulatory-like domain/TonB dependent receptor